MPLIARQREIITLAGHGMSNREIAERLTMSVRTVEGHLFRASQRTGVSTRQALIALVTPYPSDTDRRRRVRRPSSGADRRARRPTDHHRGRTDGGSGYATCDHLRHANLRSSTR
ncbi:helix-turn-helix domain-containing protein [Aldersonia kunmingensis]|uniref:response regulator transcription factor n=1 Tax=Aldersonia kunmingensis TaxID=408066 RepID=UPI000A78253C